MKRKITFLLSAIFALTLITLSFSASGQTFKRLSSVSLSDGDEIIFVNQAETYACGTTQNTNNRTPVSITTSDHTYTKSNNDNVQVFTVKINNSGKYGFHTGSGYIYSASNSDNYLRTNSDATSTAPSGTAAWSLSVSSSVFSCTNVSNAKYYLAFNGTSYFSQYKSGMSKPYIYKKAYTVTYNGNGSTSGTAPTDSYSPYFGGDEVTVLGEGTLAKTDYSFNGWNTKSDGSGTPYDVDETFEITENTVLYAQWIPATTDPYFEADDVEIAATATGGTINYVVNNSVTGGKVSATCTAGGAWISAVTVTDEDADENTVTFSTSINATGEREGTIRLTYTYNTSETKTIDVTITQLTSTYTVTYNANHGIVDPVVDGPFNYNTSVSAKAANTFTAPSGKTFGSWNTQADGNGTDYAAGATITSSITSNISLFAKWVDIPTYSLVTSVTDIVPGAHYIIANSKTAGTAYAMDSQNGTTYRNRKQITVKVEDRDDDGNNETFIEAAGVYEFVISGDGTNYWTVYDEDQATNHYLAATGGTNNNYLNVFGSVDGKSQWSISIDGSSKEATIVAQISGSDARNHIRYNNTATQERFACYKSSNEFPKVYIYKRDGDTDCHIYSATTLSNGLTVAGDMNIHAGVVTVPSAKTLTVNGGLTNGTAANLVINDGGQLITSSTGVKATIKKNIAKATNGEITNWYLISSPVGTVSTAVVEENDINLYAYNEANLAWNGYLGSNGFENLVSGKGYLYRNSKDVTLSFTGTVATPGTVAGISLSCKRDDDFAGFNLLGNPYSQKISSSCISFSNDAEFTGVYTLGTDGEWYSAVSTDINPCEGFLVQVDKATTASFGTPAKGTTYNNDYIQFTVANSQYEDVTYALFSKGNGLTKINHRNADIPMLYINQNNKDYAIANFSDNTKSFNLCFKAMTTGRYTLKYNSTGEYNYLHVIDRLTGADVDMLLEGEYSFIATPSDNTNRFIVRLEYMPDYSECNDEIFAFQNGNEVLVSGSGELQIFDVTGRSVMTTTINGAESITIPTQGVYIFRLVGNEVKTQKIVVR